MRLFGRPSPNEDENQDDPNSPARESLESARAALAAGDATEALRLLTFGFTQDSSLRALYATSREALDQLGAPEESVLFARALADFASPKPFYDLGYHFVGADNNRLAIPFLERAHQLAPRDVSIANELALALCGHFQPERASDVLGPVLEAGSSRLFWPWFQLCWARLLANRREGIQDWIEEGRAIAGDARLDEEQKFNLSYALDKMESCLRRLEAVGEPQPIIPDWHFIQYGAGILDLMDESVTEDAFEVAGGRYVALWGQPESIRRVLEMLKEFLTATEQKPRVVVAHEDRDSQIIGLALSQVLGLPFESADERTVERPHALVVVADNRAVGWEALRSVAPGQILFAFNQNWLENSPVTPDVCGLMTQTFYFPWQGGGMKIDPDTQEVTQSEPDEREAEEIARELAQSEFEPLESSPTWAARLEFYVSQRALLANTRPGAPRLPFLTDSAVPGSYFC